MQEIKPTTKEPLSEESRTMQLRGALVLLADCVRRKFSTETVSPGAAYLLKCFELNNIHNAEYIAIRSTGNPLESKNHKFSILVLSSLDEGSDKYLLLQNLPLDPLGIDDETVNRCRDVDVYKLLFTTFLLRSASELEDGLEKHLVDIVFQAHIEIERLEV